MSTSWTLGLTLSALTSACSPSPPTPPPPPPPPPPPHAILRLQHSVAAPVACLHSLICNKNKTRGLIGSLFLAFWDPYKASVFHQNPTTDFHFQETQSRSQQSVGQINKARFGKLVYSIKLNARDWKTSLFFKTWFKICFREPILTSTHGVFI